MSQQEITTADINVTDPRVETLAEATGQPVGLVLAMEGQFAELEGRPLDEVLTEDAAAIAGDSTVQQLIEDIEAEMTGDTEV